MSGISEFFTENGYYHAKNVFDPLAVIALEADFDRIVRQLSSSGEEIDATWDGDETRRLSKPDDRIVHTHNVQKYSRVWLDAILSSDFTHIASEVLGDDIILHHSKLFQKPAENGSPFPMHQDWQYFPTEKDTMIAGVIHVSDASDEMGCLRVYPGSHKLGRVNHSDGRKYNEALKRYPIEKALAVEAQAGDVVFFHYCTLHGSMPNRSTAIRKTVLCQMYSGFDKVEDGNKHPNEKLVIKGWNHRISRASAGR